MAAQGGDPIPELPYCQPPYSMRIIKEDNIVKFEINDVLIFTYIDDGITYGKILNGGKIGFRQMAPMVAEYSNLRVYTKQK